MLRSALGFNGCFSAPHRAAALTGRDVLREGGSAIEAMVAAAATIAVVYPHMNGLGGDAFWLIHRPGEAPFGISGAGRAAALATPQWYAERGHEEIPARGAEAALLVPGAVASWAEALRLVGPRPMPLSRLFADAIAYARDGVAVVESLERLATEKRAELERVPGFAPIYLPGGAPPRRGARLKQDALGATLARLADAGLDDFYRGDIGAAHGRFLSESGSPLRTTDLATYAAECVTPLRLQSRAGTLYNLPPPTQGIASLLILGVFERLGIAEAEGFAHVHGLVEATKRAYRLRNRHLGDPDSMTEQPEAWLDAGRLDAMAADIAPSRALPWPEPSRAGDTVWMGAADREGTVVSFIQSVFWEFGSGLTCPDTGIMFENRGAGFSLKPGPNQLAPGKRPFHTLNPALAALNDGRVMAYGNMGGEGQPQTQSAVFTRYALFGQELQAAITAPRWLLGRTWGDASTALKLESRFHPDVVAALAKAGHVVQSLGAFEDAMGHAGAVVLHPDGLVEGASDPRSDGAAIAF